MKQSASREARERRKLIRLQEAETEADKLRQIVKLHESMSLSWAEAQARVGLVLPHSTFHQRLAKFQKSGVKGLVDQRHPPPSPLTPEIRGFIEGFGQSDGTLPTKAIQAAVAKRFAVALAIRTIEEALQAAGLARPRTRIRAKAASVEPVATPPALPTSEADVQKEELGGAGLAWLRVASELTGYGHEMASVVSEVARSLAPPPEPIPVDNAHRDDRGRFLPEYNEPRERRDPQVGAVFESVEEKRRDKDLTRLSIASTKVETLEKKLLALMALPMVSERGRFDGVTDPRGEWFESLGSHDYMPETLAKFAREMKWAGVSGALIERHATLWYELFRASLGEEASAVVLYVDATAKPYWTDFFHKSGRVPTVGRVMPCLESALIHTGSGVPLYLKTFAGHAPLVKNVLPLIHQMEAAIGQGMLGRLTVIDGEMNAVALFKQFDADINPATGEKGRYFITPLSHAQVKTLDAVNDLTAMEPYRDGDQIASGSMDLVDSKDKQAPPYHARVIVLQRRTKKTFSAYATNAPAETYAAPVLMDTYFNRWPAQEQVFRELNNAVAFKAIHGYGKRRVTNIAVVDELTHLKVQIQRGDEKLNRTRAEETDARATLDEAITTKGKIESARDTLEAWMEEVAGRTDQNSATYQRAVSEAHEAASYVELAKSNIERAHAWCETAAAKIEKLESALMEKTALAEKLESRREIYQTDVELDQILSVLKLGCALLVQFLLHRFFNGLAIEFNTFIHQILTLSGTRIITPTTETIQFRGNRRSPAMMKALAQACLRFNALAHRRDDRVVRFEVVWPPVSHHAT